MFCSLAVNSDDAILDPASKPVKHNALSPAVYRIHHAIPFSMQSISCFLIFSAAIIPAHFRPALLT